MAGDKVQCLDTPPNGGSSTELLGDGTTVTVGGREKIFEKQNRVEASAKLNIPKRQETPAFLSRLYGTMLAWNSLQVGLSALC
jgi:hypothetical protein